MKKPLIGITPQYDIERNRIFIGPAYTTSIIKNGGIPVLLPLETNYNDLKQLSNSLDGFLFTGGPDIDPIYFKEEPIVNYGTIVPKRDAMESFLFSIALDSNKPMFGICRGIQVFNVFLGGTIYQDIMSQHEPTYDFNNQGKSYHIDHYQKSENAVKTHSIHIEKDTLLHRICNTTTIRVNSFHHQAVKTLPNGVIPSSLSYDSIVESIELPNHPFFLGVQWHPEHLTGSCPYAKQLFSSFIDAC